MRKILAFLVLLMLPWAARGQALADWYYWFDTDETPRESGKLSGKNTNLQVDVSQLDMGVHTLFVQVVDKDGVYSPPVGKVFVHMPDISGISKLYYSFNGDSETHSVDFGSGKFSIDVSGCVTGLNTINLQVMDKQGTVSGIMPYLFYKTAVASTSKLYYWFEGDETATQVTNFRNGFVIDVSRVKEGFNTIYFQLEDDGPTDIQAHDFIKIPQTENAEGMTLLCIVDGKIIGQEKVASNGGVVKCNMDVSKMETGLHKAMFQLITASGAASSIAETYFIRTLTNDEVSTMQCSYTIDGFNSRAQKGTCKDGVFHFDLPVNEVEDGLHRIDYMLVAENGATTNQGSAWFIKTPVGGNVITQYEYWLNENEERHTVPLDKKTNPYSLMALLPVETEPIRSSCFHFETKDGKPMMYAKNDFHIAFYDITGRRVDESKQYVDYNVSEEVKDIADLQSTQTFARLNDNDIKWFKFEAAPGDTIGFKSSQATSIQVFAPSGKEILSTMGDKSVQYSGAHTWENGTYYVAVHDVTGTKPSVTLDYMHMDKYDVVDQDVRVVGNGGCSTITFQGNGFRDLYAVDLYTAQGDTIHSVDVGHESDASTTVTFDFTGAALGKYTALFRFTQEDKPFADNITVEEAKDIELATKVSYPSTFLRGTSVTYTVEITNKGNMTAYYVPTYLYVESPSLEGVSSIRIKGIDIPHLFEGLDVNSIPTECIKYIQTLTEKTSDDVRFIAIRKLNDAGDSTTVRICDMFVTIPPKSTQTITLDIAATELLSVYATIPQEWNVFALTTNENNSKANNSHRVSTKGIAQDYCCIRDRIECVLDISAIACDIVSPIAGILSNWIPPAKMVSVTTGLAGCAVYYKADQLKAFGESFCNSDNSTIKNALINMLKSGVKAKFAAPSRGSIISCIGGILSSLTGLPNEAYIRAVNAAAKALSVGALMNDASNIFTGDTSCSTISDKKPNCPPNPGGGGGSSTPVNSLDPNDIYGYTHESGSKYINEDVVTVPYRIEFENDTTFATASAHTVIVKDTLDATKFDLASYQPTSIKIGDKHVMLNGDKQFATTIDMRPAIYAIAQVEGTYDEKKGIATWKFTSLDPITMEPTDDVMQGFLPVNYDGSGIGEVAFDISLKGSFADGTEIPNKASIVFDNNDPIMTPTWTNIIDAVAPVSKATDMALRNDTTAIVRFEGSDERSGVWKYEVYAQQGINAPWIKIAEVPADSSFVEYRIYDDIDYGYCTLAVDSAGNVENKTLRREVGAITYILGDADGDGFVTMADAKLVVDGFLGRKTKYINVKAADVNGDGKVTMADANAIVNICLGRK